MSQEEVYKKVKLLGSDISTATIYTTTTKTIIIMIKHEMMITTHMKGEPTPFSCKFILRYL